MIVIDSNQDLDVELVISDESYSPTATGTRTKLVVKDSNQDDIYTLRISRAFKLYPGSIYRLEVINNSTGAITSLESSFIMNELNISIMT